MNYKPAYKLYWPDESIHYILSSKTLPALNKVWLRDTSGPKLLDTSSRKTLPALKLLDTSGPEVFGQVQPRDKSGPETSLAPRQVRPLDKSSPETSPAQKCLDKSGHKIFLLLLSLSFSAFFIKQQFQAPKTSPTLRHVWQCMDLNISKMIHTLYVDSTHTCFECHYFQKHFINFREFS